MKKSCCIDMMFSQTEFYDRIAQVKKSGIDAIEFWKWSNKDIDRVCMEKEKNGLYFSVFNIDCKDERLSYDLSRGILNTARKVKESPATSAQRMKTYENHHFTC